MANLEDTLPQTFPQEVRDAFEWFKTEGRMIHGDFRAYMEATDRNLKVLTDFANDRPEGSLLGRMVSYPVADGMAMYMVTSESPLYLAHVNFGDGYMIPAAHLRGLNYGDIEERVAWDARWRALLSV